MGNFFEDVIQPDSRFHSSNRVSDIALLEPNTRKAVQGLVAEAAASGIPLIIYETYRSQERQEALFAQKVTELKTVGVHHYGLACDIVKSSNGQPSWQGDFGIIGQLARKYGLIWGGDWGRPDLQHAFRDDPHVQRCSVADQNKLFQLSWYPDDSYNPYGDLTPAAAPVPATPAKPAAYRLTQPPMSGDTVRNIQQALINAGFDPGTPDGVFGPQTQSAVIALQQSLGLQADGVVGPKTAAALNVQL